jgi:preprotein translocase subunit SecG
VRILLNCLHVVAALVMIVVVLLQQGKGADIGAAFGAGSSQTLFGSRGAGNFLTKMTTAFVVIFMGTSITLSYLAAPRSVLEGIEIPAPATPATEPVDGETGSEEVPSGFEAVPTPEGESAPESSAPATPETPSPEAAPPAPTSEAPSPEAAPPAPTPAPVPAPGASDSSGS